MLFYLYHNYYEYESAKLFVVNKYQMVFICWENLSKVSQHNHNGIKERLGAITDWSAEQRFIGPVRKERKN